MGLEPVWHVSRSIVSALSSKQPLLYFLYAAIHKTFVWCYKQIMYAQLCQLLLVGMLSGV